MTAQTNLLKSTSRTPRTFSSAVAGERAQLLSSGLQPTASNRVLPATRTKPRAQTAPYPIRQTSTSASHAAFLLIVALYASLALLDWGSTWASLLHQWHSFLDFLVSGMLR